MMVFAKEERLGRARGEPHQTNLLGTATRDKAVDRERTLGALREGNSHPTVVFVHLHGLLLRRVAPDWARARRKAGLALRRRRGSGLVD